MITSITALVILLLFVAYVQLQRAAPMVDYGSATEVLSQKTSNDEFVMSTAPDVCSSATTPTDCHAPCVWNLATGMCQTANA